MIGGRKMMRDHSTDSIRSSESNNKKVAFAEDGINEKASSLLHAPPTTSTSANPAIVESMRNLGNSLNPMNRISGMTFPRAFGRPTSSAAAKSIPDGGVADLTTVSNLNTLSNCAGLTQSRHFQISPHHYHPKRFQKSHPQSSVSWSCRIQVNCELMKF